MGEEIFTLRTKQLRPNENVKRYKNLWMNLYAEKMSCDVKLTNNKLSTET